MEITPHLSEAELAEFVSNPSRGVGTHLEYCDSCLNEVAHLREVAAELKTAADQPVEFWQQQRAAIRQKVAAIPTRQAYGFSRLAWAPVFAVVVLAGLLLSGGTPTPIPAVQAKTLTDHELLVAVERVMQSNGPVALEPANYFVQEIKQETNSTISQERRNEN